MFQELLHILNDAKSLPSGTKNGYFVGAKFLNSSEIWFSVCTMVRGKLKILRRITSTLFCAQCCLSENFGRMFTLAPCSVPRNTKHEALGKKLIKIWNFFWYDENSLSFVDDGKLLVKRFHSFIHANLNENFVQHLISLLLMTLDSSAGIQCFFLLLYGFIGTQLTLANANNALLKREREFWFKFSKIILYNIWTFIRWKTSNVVLADCRLRGGKNMSSLPNYSRSNRSPLLRRCFPFLFSSQKLSARANRVKKSESFAALTKKETKIARDFLEQRMQIQWFA